MEKKPSFPKVNLKYPTLEAFAKAVRKSFGQGRLLVRLKKEFNPNQRLLLVFQLGDRDQPVEIIGQIMDRIPDQQKGGFAYGIRFLNFTENKLNRLLAGEDLKSPKPEPEKKETTPGPEPPEKLKIPEPPSPEEIQEQLPKSVPAPETTELRKEPPAPEPEFEEEIIIQAGTQTFKAQPEEVQEKEAPSAEVQITQEIEPKPEPEPPTIASKEEPKPPLEPIAEELERPSLEEPLSTIPSQAEEQFAPSSPEPAPEVQESTSALEETTPPGEQFPSAPEPTPPLETQPSLFEGSIPAKELSAPPSEPPPIEEPTPAPEPGTPLLEFSALQTGTTISEKPVLLSEEIPSPGLAPESEEELFQSPDPALLTEAKPIPKIEMVPPDAEVGELAPSEEVQELTEELSEMTGEVTEEAPPTTVLVEAKPPIVEPSPAEVEFKPISSEQLSDFLFRFCRIILSPPSPDLPDSGRQIQSLFEDFQKLMQARDRLNLYLVLSPSGKDFIIEGAQATPKSIRVLLPPDRVGTLIFRLIELFDEKELVGIFFRKYLDLVHFQNFIFSLSQFQPEKESPDQLALKLIRSGIFHFNLIFETDLIAVPEKVKEETKILLARLASDLKRLKALAEQMSEEPLALLTLRIEEILKPVKDPEVLAQLLEHLPLIWSNQQDFEFQDLEDQILFSIPVSILTKSAEFLVKKLIRFQSPKAKPEELEKAQANLQRLLRRVMARIAYEAPEQALQTLAELFDREIIKYEELPEEIRDQVASAKLAQEFLKAPEEKIAQLEKASEKNLYSKLASQQIWTSIALMEKKQFKWAQKIFQTLVAHYQDPNPPFPERPKLARQSLKRLGEPFAIELLAQMLTSGNKEARELSAGMLYATGEASVKKLLTLLELSEDRNVRRLICEILARIGQKIVPALLEKLSQKEIPWYLARNIIMILAELKSPALKDQIEQFLKYPHPRVREEAIAYLLALGEKQMEQNLAELLKDPDSSVQRRALSALIKTEKLSPETLLALKNLVINLIAQEPDPNLELIFQQALDLLSRYPEEKLSDETIIRQFLFDLFKKAEARGILSGPKILLSPKMRASLIDAVGKAKIKDAQKILSKLSKDKDEQIRKSAEKALELIEKS